MRAALSWCCVGKPPLSMQIQEKHGASSAPHPKTAGSSLRPPSHSLGNGLIRAILSPRAGGLVLDVNVNPGASCNFACAYCEVDRTASLPDLRAVSSIVADELTHALDFVRSGRIYELSGFKQLASRGFELRQVALTGDGEPTLVPNFREIVEAVMHVRALGRSFFKVGLLTNASRLHLPQVQQALQYFTREDEVWLKLDAGSQGHLQKINGTTFPLETLLNNIQRTANRRPVVIQTLFSFLSGEPPPPREIAAFVQKLLELRNKGAQISSVQIHSASSSDYDSKCRHLPLQSLSGIARTIRAATGLKVEVY